MILIIIEFFFRSFILKSRRSTGSNANESGPSQQNGLASYSIGAANLSNGSALSNDQTNSLLLNANNSSNSNDTSILFNAGSLFNDVHQLYSSALVNGGQSAINSLSAINAMNANSAGNSLLTNPAVDLVRPLNLPYSSPSLSAAALLNNQLASLQASLRSNSSPNFSPMLNSSSLSANSSPISLNSKTSADSKSKLNLKGIHPLLANGLNLNSLTSLNNLLSKQLGNDLIASPDLDEDDYEDEPQLHSIHTDPDLSNDACDQPLDFSIKSKEKCVPANSRKRKRTSDMDDSYEFAAAKRSVNGLDLTLLDDKDLLKQLAMFQAGPPSLNSLIGNSLNSSSLGNSTNNAIRNQLENGVDKLDIAASSLLVKNLLNSDLANAGSLFTNGLLNGQNLLGNQLLTNGMLNGTSGLLNANSLLNSLNGGLLSDASASDTFLNTLLLQNQARLLSGDLSGDLVGQLDSAKLGA